ncbi:MAG: glycosyl hydrolase family 28 protein [Mariniphaga sp.]
MKQIQHWLVLFIFLNTGSFFTYGNPSDVRSYPAVEELSQSRLFSLEVNEQQIWVEKYVSNLDFDKLPDWFNEPDVRKPQELHIANFEGTGSLRISLLTAGIPSNVKIKPASKKITPVIDGHKISFMWEGPGQLVVEMDDLPPLFLFANPAETETVQESTPGVKYFGPGVHHPGYIEMKDNETVYIAEGAVVYGGIRANGVSNIRVLGRGILDGNYEFRQMVYIEESKNILFEGVTIRNGKSWTNTLVNCRDVEYRFVKVFGFGPSSDGINPAGSQRVRITNCLLRCTDDCIAIKAPNYNHPVKDIFVADNIMIGYAYADGVTIGFETNAETISNVVVQNCDILMARGGSMVEGHSGFSIICDGPAVIQQILFENIRVERADIKLFELNVTPGKYYGDDPPGHIRDITLKDVDWAHEGPIVIHGFGENNRVQDVLLKRCTVAGKPLKKQKDKILDINEFTHNIKIK